MYQQQRNNKQLKIIIMNNSGIEVIKEKLNKRTVWFFYYPKAQDKVRTNKKMAQQAIEKYNMSLQFKNENSEFYA